MGDFCMPSLGAEMDVGRLVEWLVEPGQQVHRGDIVAVVETDKANLEVEVWEDGVVEELLVDEGTRVPVGTPLARIGGGTDAPPAPVTAPAAAAPPARPDAPRPVVESSPPVPTPAVEPSQPAPVTVSASEPAGEASPVHVRGPLARHRAAELGVDLGRVRGSGPAGEITRHDVEAAAASRVRASPYARTLARAAGLDLTDVSGSGPGGAIVARDLPEPTVGPNGDAPTTSTADEPETPAERSAAEAMRSAIARAMARSKREIPHYYLGTHVDVTAALAWLEERNAQRPVDERVLPAALLLKAVALAARRFPELNGYWVDEEFQPAPDVNLGVAIALRGGGLVAPALHRTDTLTLDEVMARLRDLVRRTRSGRLRGSEFTDATLTVSNLGDLGVETVYGVIYPPQVALVGIGRPSDRPWAIDGAIGVRRVIHVTLAADHRQSDGHTGGRFLTALEDLLQRPEEL